MKGPGFRLNLDPRRLWECPACGRRLKFHGNVTSMTCDCRGEKSPAMRLVEGVRRTESPFDHVGYAAQKRIDAAIKKPLDAEDTGQKVIPGPVDSPLEPALPDVACAHDAGHSCPVDDGSEVAAGRTDSRDGEAPAEPQ